jgi:hypothetical protein
MKKMTTRWTWKSQKAYRERNSMGMEYYDEDPAEIEEGISILYEESEADHFELYGYDEE